MVRSKDCLTGVSREVVEILLYAGLIKTGYVVDTIIFKKICLLEGLLLYVVRFSVTKDWGF
jgi:hypothetical protein